MESNLIKKYMQNIEDFVFIEDKIVTYLWLCQILKIHANTAKQLLHAFAIKEDVKNKLLITYVLGGELKNGKGRLLKLIIGDSKEAVKQLFSKITTDHIFSIQKSGGSFSSTDIFNSFPHFSVLPETRRFCPIRQIKEIEKRDINHITEAKNFLNPSVPVKKQIVPKETESSKKEVKNEGSIISSKKSENSADSSEPPAKQKKTSGNEKDLKSKGGDIGSFFSRQAEKKSSEQPGNKGKSEKKEEKARTGIGAFFKPGNKCDISAKEDKVKETTLKPEIKENEKKEIPEVKKQNGVNETVSTTSKDKKNKSAKDSKRKRKKKDEDGIEKKRRKRIVSALSSDSESSGNETSDCEMEVEPEQPPPPPVLEEDEDMIPPTPGRKRVRKQIDKVSMDEDGFIITKKEFVYESCSDDEAKEEKKENKENKPKEDKTDQKTSSKNNEVTPNNVKQNKSPNNDKSNKQSSITNFFKRKAVT